MEETAPSETERELRPGYSLLIYPFQHRLPDNGLQQDKAATDKVLTGLAQDWEPWLRRALTPKMRTQHPDMEEAQEKEERKQSLDGLKWEVDDSYFLVASARALMCPDLVELSHVNRTEKDFMEQVAEKVFCKLSKEGDDLAKWCGPHKLVEASTPGNHREARTRPCALRLTLRPEALDRYNSLEIDLTGSSESEEKPEKWPSVRFAWIDMVLFPQGIGFLVLKIDHDPSWSHDVCRRFSREVRKVWAPKVNMPSAPLRMGGIDIRWTNILEYLLASAVERGDERSD